MLNRGGGQGLVGHFVDAVMTFAQLFDAPGVDVENEHVRVAGKNTARDGSHSRGERPVCGCFQVYVTCVFGLLYKDAFLL